MQKKLTLNGNNNLQALIVVSTVLLCLGLSFLIGLYLTTVPDPQYTGQYIDVSTIWYTYDSYRINKASNLCAATHIFAEEQATLQKGDSYTIHMIVPDFAPAEDAPCLFFKGQSCAVEVYLSNPEDCFDTGDTTPKPVLKDEDRIYSANMDLLASGKMVPRSLHYLALPVHSEGKILTIVYHASKNNITIVTNGCRYGQIEALARVQSQSKKYIIVAGQFLSVFGIILMLLPVLMVKKDDIRRNLFQGLLLLDIGIYISCFNDVFTDIIPNNTVSTILEYITLISVPLFIHATLIAIESQKQFLFNKLFIILDVAIILLVLILHITNTLHINESGTIVHLYIAICGLYTIYRIIYVDIIKRHKIGSDLYGNIADRVTHIGLLLMIVLFYAELVLWKAGISNISYKDTDIRGVVLLLGFMFFIGCSLLSYLFHTVATMRKDDVAKKLKGLAYTDKLTGLSNRAYCDRILETYQMEQQDAIVISLDLDGLKIINDTLGHQEGDIYITGFANFLKQSFPDAALVGRMGGDEFIIILKSLDLLRCESLLDQLNKLVNQYNEKNADAMPKITYSYSYGYATTKENSGNGYHIRQTYMLADQRMYHMKEEHHKIICRGGAPA